VAVSGSSISKKIVKSFIIFHKKTADVVQYYTYCRYKTILFEYGYGIIISQIGEGLHGKRKKTPLVLKTVPIGYDKG
jgi:hypothetical protein